MSSNRYISTSFYDDAWVSELDPSEKFMYLYLITNALTNIAGVYKITKKRISFDTGFNIDTVSHILNRFESVKKACLCNEYMIIPSFPKNQSLNENMKKGLVDIVSKLPEEVLEKMNELNYSYDISAFLPKKEPFESLSNPSNYSNLNSNTNSNLNLDTETDVSDNSSSVANAPSSEFANNESTKVSEDSDDTSSSPTTSEDSLSQTSNTFSTSTITQTPKEKESVPAKEKEKVLAKDVIAHYAMRWEQMRGCGRLTSECPKQSFAIIQRLINNSGLSLEEIKKVIDLGFKSTEYILIKNKYPLRTMLGSWWVPIALNGPVEEPKRYNNKKYSPASPDQLNANESYEKGAWK